MTKEPAFGRVFSSSSGDGRLAPGALAGLLFCIVALATAGIYWGGLAGAFILDDEENLQRLAGLTSPLTFSQLVEFLSSRLAGPLGRPVSMLTFALQHEAWPADPQRFKLVNLLIHLTNGALLFVLLLAIQRVARPAAKAYPWVALVAAGLWLVHPIHVSTVLYVVQRMTELAATFTLLGLLGYILGRHHAERGRVIAGYALMSVSVAAGTVLAALSKENGVLLPLYVMVLEFTLLHDLPRPRWWKAWGAAFLALPVAALAAYLALQLPQYLAVYAQRDFGLGERLLTQGRVLLDYLVKLLLPRPGSFGLFFDDFAVSRGWLNPPATSVAAAIMAGLLAAAVVVRRKAPVLSFGVLWFFAGHVLESSVLPLELYYEHRNYLPAVGPLFAAVYCAARLLTALRGSPPFRIAAAAFVVLLAAFPAVTWSVTGLWGDPVRQAVVWAAERPGSARAVERAGAVMAMGGHPAEAFRYFSLLAERFPDQAVGYYQWLLLACYDPGLPLPSRTDLVQRSRQAQMSYGVLGALDAILGLREQGKCAAVDAPLLASGIDALLEGGRYGPRAARLLVARARSLRLQGRIDEALNALDAAYAQLPRMEIVVLKVRWLLEAGRPEDAGRVLAERLGSGSELTPGLAGEVARLREQAQAPR